MQWASLRDIDEVEPINATDSDCLTEIRDVLMKHGKLERFGVALLHSHFPLGDDEIMLETADPTSRTLTLAAVKEADAGNNKVGTIWVLRDDEPSTMSWCRQYCRRWALGHVPAHHKQK
jgi:hypothetical protein